MSFRDEVNTETSGRDEKLREIIWKRVEEISGGDKVLAADIINSHVYRYAKGIDEASGVELGNILTSINTAYPEPVIETVPAKVENDITPPKSME